MLGVSSFLVNSGDGAAAAAGAHETGGEVGVVEEEKVRIEEGDRNSGGNRWPKQEALTLLKIRSDMDVVFRDSSLKGPLWEEVSRKLAELGYHRSAKKCKEKFENVYKYHKRTKEGRASKPDGKTYRFFDQLKALENHPPPKPQTTVAAAAAVAMPAGTNPPLVAQVTVPSITNPINVSQNTITPSINPTNPSPQLPPTNPFQSTAIPSFYPNISVNLMSNSTSSSTSSDEDLDRLRTRKRKWKDFFGRLMKEVIEKQEQLQKKFLDALDKRERDRMVREEAWRVQEMTRMNREHDLLVQERSIAAAKDAAVIAFLQKMSEQQIPNVPQIQMPVQLHENPLPPPPPQRTPPPPTKTLGNGGENFVNPTSSRWPKAEVEALIRLRTNMDLKYQENGPKGPLWEEMSAAMRKLGYNRNAKRCKEKWENINKYFKKVKESNKKRPEDSKTCPYFHQLDALYKEKNKTDTGSFNPMVPIMVQPEQQWPLPVQEQQHNQPESGMEDHESEHIDQNHEDEDGSDEEDDEDGYEIVTNKPPSVAMVE
uniref:Putative trihelix transcription factor GT-2-like n=1 Tax=Davidia involucrata TaxID=16924 RepID=A0A5B6ZYD5_DAVIN